MFTAHQTMMGYGVWVSSGEAVQIGALFDCNLGQFMAASQNTHFVRHMVVQTCSLSV